MLYSGSIRFSGWEHINKQLAVYISESKEAFDISLRVNLDPGGWGQGCKLCGSGEHRS